MSKFRLQELMLKIKQQECQIMEKELKIASLQDNIENIKRDIQISEDHKQKLQEELEALTKEGDQ